MSPLPSGHGMRQFQALLWRELMAWFLSPMSYLVATVFLVASGYLFATAIHDGAQASMAGTFSSIAFLMLFAVPLLTMRLVAEELRQGTLEVLLSDPVSEATLVLAKFGAAYAFVLLMLAPTLAYPFVLAHIGAPDPGPLLAGYLGISLLGAAFVAVGLATSAATANQIAAGALSFTVLFVSWALGRAAGAVSPGPLRDVLDYVSMLQRYTDFERGVVDTRSLVYYGGVVALGLFVAGRALGLRRLL